MDAPVCLIEKRNKAICDIPPINKGSEATDFGFLVLSPEEKAELLKTEPHAAKWIRHYIGGDEFINNIERYCLWMNGMEPTELKTMPKVMERVKKVQEARLASDKLRTREWAKLPTLFTENRQPESDYLAVPKVSSERRSFIPNKLDAAVDAAYSKKKFQGDSDRVAFLFEQYQQLLNSQLTKNQKSNTVEI